ncbi:MAG: hypothetical protein KAT75_07240 [Dehalococcoidia bacterium]|nr:hypothetical protein [Dehalococcoidia bacterium]
MELNKTVRLGMLRTAGGRSMSVFAKIELEDGNLSITGVEGPLPSGNCLGSCGQIDISHPHMEKLAPGWSQDMLKEVLGSVGSLAPQRYEVRL